jgi:peptidoglycan hydrolase-like protein with peptidoglycan-binding domain
MSRSIWAAALTILVVALAPGVASAANNKKSSSSVAVASSRLVGPGDGFGLAGGAPRVRLIQRKLAAMGFAPGPIDGLYGPITTAAVARFQQSRGLVPDGIVGPITRAALNRGGLSLGAGFLQPRGLRAVRSLQRELRRTGFSPGPIDGRYGLGTTRAVRRFQSAHRLTPNGVAGTRTMHALVVDSTRRPTPKHTRGRAPRRRPATAPATAPAPNPNPRVASGRPSQTHGYSAFQLVAAAVLAVLGGGVLVALVRSSRRQHDRRKAESSKPETQEARPASPTTPSEAQSVHRADAEPPMIRSGPEE